MKSRYLKSLIEEFPFQDHKMAFISGPRQCGKTTLAKSLLRERNTGDYYNWDDVNFRRIWAKNPSHIISPSTGRVPVIALDEIHKANLWKRTLKGVYDTLEYSVDIVVTGSARLDVYKKGGDSLLGRYYRFRLHPFSMREIHNSSCLNPDQLISHLFTRAIASKKNAQKTLNSFVKFGGFPEPLFSQNERKARIWRQNRVERVIREDLRDLSRIPELSRIEMLAALLPEKVGSLFSLSSLAEDLEVSYPTVKRWVESLKQLYYLFEIKPYQKNIKRSLKKEGKVYLWDYSEIPDPAARFENLVACHLLKTCHYWTDGGEGKFDLAFLRNKDGKEIDFLILKDNRPWLPVEVKSGMSKPSSNWPIFLKQLPCKQALQLVLQPGQFKMTSVMNSKILVVSACEGLGYFA